MSDKSKSERALKEEKILAFWKENQIFEKSLEKNPPAGGSKGEFVFYDGPPFATGLPHHGSLLSSIIKDVVPRYKTMRGYHVRRRWGWDCHGLPIENMIEKELGIKDKTEIEGKVGIKAFNEACRASVMRYARDWKEYVDRIGRWVEYDNAYKTMDNTYIESVWHALEKINDKGLLYEGRKVLLYCPHCQTPIAKAEIAMDNSYKDVTEESVYVKFKIVGFPDAYFLAWTTTPWTLPGNLALAVNPNVTYVEAKVGKDTYVVAKEKLALLTDPYEVVAEHKGGEMVGMQYEPLYRITEDSKAYKIYAADFVTTEDGTGIVHTAVLYGEDDYQLGQREGLPSVQLLDQAAHFNDLAPEFVRGQYFKKAERAIKEDLEERGLMFKKEMNTHSYPHCHRCGTALLYNALTSWFINIQKVKDRMIKLNEKVNWVPDHLKHGRFLNIVENAPDWTISRNRYWAAPLPIWKDNEGTVTIIGSLDDLKKHTKKSGNEFYVMRHGEADNNVAKVVSCRPDNDHHLTAQGKAQAQAAARDLRNKDIDLIIASPYFRTRETALAVANVIDLDTSKIIFDDRLREYDSGEYDGRPEPELREFFQIRKNIFDDKPIGGESFRECKKRLGEFLYETDAQYEGKNILIVTHRICGWLIAAAAEAMDPVEADKLMVYMQNADVRKLSFNRLPHNDNFELDLHRPYIDEVELVTEEGKPLKRIPEVIDGWLESGSMPFAEYHYPFENKEEFEASFPGDFVAEYISQTRTWFYYMHTMAVLLFDDISFRNVVSTGTVLAGDGAKISKSKGNYTNPLILLDQYGADAFRYYLMSSVVMQAEDVLFKDEEIKDVHNRLINILANSFTFYELYADPSIEPTHKSKNILDRWIVAKFNQLVEVVSEGMDAYNLVEATRPVRDFVTDLSTWYIRRSRDRFKGEGDDRVHGLATARYIFTELSKLIAPVMPFIAEEIYQKVRRDSDPTSVHMCGWPEGGKPDKDLLTDMEETRRLVSLALEERQKANIKVRQPLSKLEIRNSKLGKEYLELICDEVNVKEVVDNKDLEVEVRLDTNITPELAVEGQIRDEIRAIQDMRKEAGLNPSDQFTYQVPAEKKEFYMKNGDAIAKATNSVLSYLHD